jgi:cytochrome c-type biogenesis protein CcmH
MSMRTVRGILLLIAVMLAWPLSAHAVQPDEVLRNPALEARARALSKELRCMVCQNQSIDDSDAPLARDLRILVRERLTAEDTDAQVLDYLVARYGEFVLLRPRFSWQTALLWLIAPLLLIGGAVGIVLALRRRAGRTPMPPAALNDEERERLARLVPPDRH